MAPSASARLIRHASHRRRRREIDDQLPLLDDDDLSPNADVGPRPSESFDENPFAELPVYETIWKINRLVTRAISDPYTLEQLRAPRLNTTVVRPLMDELYDLQDVSIVFCLLVNRVQFLKTQAYRVSQARKSIAQRTPRASLTLCLLQHFSHSDYT